MKAHSASMINAVTLIVCGVWAYLSIGAASFTPLIPVGFGVALLLCYPSVKSENKVIAHVAVLLTVVLLIALYMPLSSALQNGLPGPLIRSFAMVITTIVALIFFVKSFRDARRARES
ncbi:MAG: hypothetical protein AAF636_21860 [Pseudomonadota bacterium]